MANTTGKKFGGRRKGTPNKDNELKKFLIDLVTDSQDKLIKELKELKGKAFVDSMFSLMEYVQPKLSRSEADVTTNGESINKPIIEFGEEKNNDKPEV